MPQQLNPMCPYCGKPVQPWESSTTVDGNSYHFDCALKDEDDAFFARDMGFED